MVDFEELADRCEAATGPDRELDGDIHAGVDGWEKLWNEKFEFMQFWKAGRWIALGSIPAYTASLDAAMTLVPEGFWKHSGTDCDGPVCALIPVSDGKVSGDTIRCWANSEALAICAAALRAHATLAKQGAE